MGYRPRDSGTANSAHKRRGRTELVDGRTKESPTATRRVKACLQGADNAKEIRRAKTINANNIDDLICGGGGSRLRTRLYGGFPANREKYREHCHVKDLVRGEIR